MTFSSLAFLFVFFPIVFLLYWILKNNQLRNILLILASLAFYAYGEPVAVFIMLISICLNYIFGLMCASRPVVRSNGARQKVQPGAVFLKTFGLVMAIILNIGLLLVFKYSDFFLVTVGLGKYAPHMKLPIGISFFTFQGLSYVVDVYRDRKSVQKNLLSVMLYISFFPQLIAGPIVKYHDIREQLTKREFSADRVSRGLQRFTFGLGKKVLIAGPMGLMVDSIYNHDIATVGVGTAWVVGISYLFQIYFDFSGYSDMAIGLGCIFGFDFKENFNYPYTAGSIQVFWRKWHISLSTWFKEYVYIPLGGNRNGTVKTYRNKFIVFLLTGLWHGANWTFICWGLVHGIGSIVEDLIKKAWNKGHREVSKAASLIFGFVGHVYTLLFVMLAFVLFRADTLSIAGAMIGKMFHIGIAANASDAVAVSLFTPTYIIAFILAVICSTSIFTYLMPKMKTWMLQTLSIAIYVLSLVMLVTGGYNPFIYFRF